MASLSDPTSAASIEWFSCPQNESTVAPYECGTLQVPLDYTNLTTGTLDLQMVRVNHTKEPFMGSILFNTGGPGLATRPLIAEAGFAFLVLTGGHFDLIGHDPRGSGNTIPYICYNEQERNISVLSTPLFADASDTAAGEIFTERYVMAQACLREQEKFGQLVGTAFAARDMMQIIDALDEDGLLRFWGFSYGSALGATAAAMFPDRMDKVVLDGVLNMHQYYTGLDYQQVLRLDEAFRSFLEACIEGSDRCVLSQQGSSADELEAKIYDLLSAIKHQPLALGPSIKDIVKYGALKVYIVTGLRQPAGTWKFLAQMLNGLFTGNLTAYRESAIFLDSLIQSKSWPELGIDATVGIRCSDHSFRTNNLTDLTPVIKEFESVSKLAGAGLAVAQPMTCAQWPFEAKERIQWTGGYRTKNPILLVGNKLDPLTPVDSAFNTSADFPGSVVVQQNTGGHTSLGHPSACTLHAIRDYFANGTIPEAGLVCQPEQRLADFSPTDKSLDKRDTMKENRMTMFNAAKKLGRMIGIN